MTVKCFEDLQIWQIAMDQYKHVVNLTKEKGFSRDFELVNQVKASSGSVPDNIAEGFDRGGKQEFRQFLSIAMGSNGEVRSQIHRAYINEYFSKEIYTQLLDRNIELANKIASLINYLNSSEYKGVKYKKNPNQ